MSFQGRPVALTKSDHAYEMLREQILDGRLAPGSTLDQEALARQLGLSTTPVREALRRLEAERLVVGRAHRDTLVVTLSLDMLEEVYAIRLALDPLAASLTASVATDDELAAIAAVAQAAPKQQTAAEYLRHNRELHRAIYMACGNALLVQMLESLWDVSDRYRIIALKNQMVVETAAAEHHQIVDALLARRVGRAGQLMKAHLTLSLESIRQLSADFSS